MRTIYKYAVKLDDVVELDLPAEARIIRFAPQAGALYVWAIIDPTADPDRREFAIRGTGHPLPEDGEYVASCEQGPFIWHLFEVRR